ncbi:DUF3450 domain-containing protein [Fretibacter rubidus]|uniref:DUF3450 domain-containing protein n=1 Tax=Fretibacter rubidus TaxID=570162 RepID=UPI00352AF3A2
MVIKHRTIATIFGASLIALSSAVTTSAQTADAEASYAALLEQIDNLKLTIAQREVYLATQQEKIDSLNGQIESSDDLAATINPMLEKMATAIENEIKTDIPFKIGERFARLDKLKEDLASPDVRPSDKMRRALQIYDIEVGYGISLEAYGGNHPKTPGARYAACEADVESEACGLSKNLTAALAGGRTLRDIRDEIFDGDYLRYGRLALSYMNADGTSAMRYDPETKDWVDLNAAQALELRRGLRTARGEAAPAVVRAPVYVTN